MAGKIRVAILDDSFVFRAILEQVLSADDGLEVVAVYSDPVTALEQIAQVRPDVISVDMEMPRMRGKEFLAKVLPRNPGLRAVVVSSLSGNVFDAMQAGAVDFIGKPGFRPGYTQVEFARDIVEVIKIAASAKPQSLHAGALGGRTPAITGMAAGGTPTGVATGGSTAPGPSALSRGAGVGTAGSKAIVAIGASTGGTEAILQVVTQFPADMPGVVIVQHMPPGFTNQYAERVDKACAMRAREAKDGDRVERGLILIAPGGDRQMRVEALGGGYRVSLKPGPKVTGHCPSVDVLFDSVAEAAGGNAVGVLLTGMGSDGAAGLLHMRERRAYTFGQDEASCVVYGMPKVAFDLGAVSRQLPLQAIGQAVVLRFAR